MDKATISLTIRKDRADKHGLCAVRLRITYARKSTYFNTGVMIKPDQWDGKEVINHPNKTSLNALLRSKLTDLEKRYIESAITGETFKKRRRTNFHEYWQKDKRSKFKNSYLKKFQDFKPVLYFSDINPALMRGYEDYCRALGNKENTVWNAVKYVKSVINQALKEGVIKSNPLIGYSGVKYKDPKRDFLTEDEIGKIETFSLDPSKHKTLRDTANWFLFSCYSFLRYSDCVTFSKKEHIVNGKIIMRTKKTESDISVKIHPRLQAVLDRLPNKIFTNYRVNRYLKLIAIDIELNKDLHFHLARHSGSVLFLTKGGSMDVLSKLLGHSEIRTTEIYGKIISLRIDDEIDKAFGS